MSRPHPAPGQGCPITAERLALALDAASSHPTGTPNRTQVTLAERMQSWLTTGSTGPDRPRRRATQGEATPWQSPDGG